ncbi:MAG: hypothetical protein ACHQU0_03200 [Candidatus Paceibacteria bacterium]
MSKPVDSEPKPSAAQPTAGALRAAKRLTSPGAPAGIVEFYAQEIENETHTRELLEALEAITENAEYQHGTTYEISTRWIDLAEAAIAKSRKP